MQHANESTAVLRSLSAALLILLVSDNFHVAAAARSPEPPSATAEAGNGIAVSINAGETYVIKDVDPEFTTLVNYYGGARAFTIQSSSRGTLVILGVERGSGTVTLTRGDERVRYEIKVNAIFDALHPLSPGKAPATIADDEDDDEIETDA